MNAMGLRIRLHINNQRQGPGSDAMTRLALTLAGVDRNKAYKIADIGCGTGAQTVVLAKALKGEIAAVDLSEAFLEKLRERTRNETFAASIKTLAASMDKLPFGRNELDIIWSEGAVYNIGFKSGVSYWRRFLKKGGILAVSELSWIANRRPGEIEEFWNREYREMDAISGNVRTLEASGYRVLAHFILPDSCWLENYYNPLLKRHREFMDRFAGVGEARRIVEAERQEARFYRKYKKYYGYCFYIAQKI